MKRALALLFAMALGALAALYLVRDRDPVPGSSAAQTRRAAAPLEGTEVYTCSMHPQVRRSEPGSCPICGMALVPASPALPESGATLALSEHALAMASVETVPVARRALVRELRAVGKIRYNESSLATITARSDGYAERLFVDFTGIEIEAGDHLAEIYSPELLVAQQELLIALEGPTAPLVETAKLKLRRLGLTAPQVQALAERRRLTERVTLLSPIQGTVIEKSIVRNSAFRAGDVLYRVANLDSVWAYLDIYEFDLAWVRYGQRVRILAEAFPGREFTGLVTFIQPLVNEDTRTVQVPVQVSNPDHALKPGMFVSAAIESAIGPDAQATPTGAEGLYTCPMHVQILREHAGPCPICGMSLVQIPGRRASAPGAESQSSGAATAPPPPPQVLAVPASAVLDSGTRRIVYVERSRGQFEPREVVLGPRSADFFPVLEGLQEGERVATRGGFLIDSQFQISGQPSLFYPEGLAGGGAGHTHGPPAAPPPDAAVPPPSPPAHRH